MIRTDESLVYKHYLNVRFAFLNLNAKYFEINAAKDVEDANMNNFHASIINCTCLTCAYEHALQEAKERASDEGETKSNDSER